MDQGQVLAGQYRLDKRLGRGGMGEVWRAVDLRMERPVAIKVVLASLGPEYHLVERLLREAKAAGSLQHHGITVVHTIGEHDGCPFLVMELLDGENLDTVLRRDPHGLAVDTVLSVAEQVCDALATAHAKGIVHRDVKPGNLILLPNGTVKVCDFGVAKLVDATTGLSHSHIIGTPSYMSPEQFTGGELDGRSDLYSVGCTLFALLAGAPPFRTDQAPMAVGFQHLNQPPPHLPELRPDTPAALADLVAQLLAKDPAGRPTDAATVRDRLRAIRTAPLPTPSDSPETVTEPATGPTRRLVAETRQLPPPTRPTRTPADNSRASVVVAISALATLGAIVAAVLIPTSATYWLAVVLGPLSLLVSLWATATTALVERLPEIRKRLLLLLAVGLIAGAGTTPFLSQLDMLPTAAATAAAGTALAVVMLILVGAPARTFGTVVAAAIAATVSLYVDPNDPARVLLGLLATVTGIAVTTFILLDAPVRRLLIPLVTVPAVGVPVLVFSVGAEYHGVSFPARILVVVAAAAVIGLLGLVRPYHVVPAALVGLVTVVAVTTVLVDPFREVAVATEQPESGCTRCRTGDLPVSDLDTDPVTSVAFSPDGNTLASYGLGDEAVKVWSLAGEATSYNGFGGAGGDISSVAFSPDGTAIAVGGSNAAQVRLLDPSTGAEKVPPMSGVATSVYSVAFSPDGTLVASGGTAAEVQLWNAATGENAGTLTDGLFGTVRSIAFSPDGTTVAAAGMDQAIHLWNLATGQATLTLHGHTDWINSVAFSPDGATLVSGSSDQTVRLWDAVTGHLKTTLTDHTDIVHAVAFSPDGATVASASGDFTARLWEVSGGAAIRTYEGTGVGLNSLAFRPDGKTIAIGGGDAAIHFWQIG